MEGKKVYTLIWKMKDDIVATKVFLDFNKLEQMVKAYIDENYDATKLHAVDKNGNIYYYGE